MRKKDLVKKAPNYKAAYIAMIVVATFTTIVLVIPGILGGIPEAAGLGIFFLLIYLMFIHSWRREYLRNKDRAQSIVVYEIIDDQKEIKTLILKKNKLEVHKHRFFGDTKECSIDPKLAAADIRRSSFYGRKDLSAIRTKKYPFIARFLDKEAGGHIFWIERDVDAEMLDSYVKRSKGIKAF